MDAATVLVLRRARRGSAASSSRCSPAAAGSSRAASAASRTSPRDGEEALLVEPGNVDGARRGARRVLSDRALAERLGAAAHGATAPGTRRRPSMQRASARWSTLRSDVGARAGRAAARAARLGGRVGRRAERRRCARALREEIDSACSTGGGSAGRRPRPGSFQLVRRWPGFLDTLLLLRRCCRSASAGSSAASARRRGRRVPVPRLRRPARRVRPAAQPAFGDRGDPRGLARRDAARRLAARVLLAPLADRAARYALRRADALRAVSPYTAALAEREAGVPPLESFPAYFDLSAFVERPPHRCPRRRPLLFVGMLERTKGIATLAAAWPLGRDGAAGRAARRSSAGVRRPTSSTGSATTSRAASSTSSGCRPRRSPSGWTRRRASCSRRAARASAA